jgi:protein-S-isoprenylcysteine O-methyltransferase Ste14
MKIQKFLFRFRGQIPVIFIILILFFGNPTRFSLITGLIILFLGEFLRCWALGYHRGTHTRRTKNLYTDILITWGPYSYCRNPIYFGNFLIGLSYCIISNIFWAIIFYVFGFYLVYSQIISLEEKYLKEKFKEEYEEYYERVPKFFPTIFPYKKKKDKFNWKSLLFSKEYQTLLQHLIIILFFLFKDEFINLI